MPYFVFHLLIILKLPNKDEMTAYINKLESDDPESLQLDTICQEPLGFYLYMNFVKENGDNVFADFLIHIAYYRTLSPLFRLEYALKIMEAYLVSGNHPSTVKTELPTESSLRRHPIKNTVLDEFESSNPLKYMYHSTSLPQKFDMISSAHIVPTPTCSEFSSSHEGEWDHRPQLSIQPNVLNIKEDCEPLIEIILSIHQSSISRRVADVLSSDEANSVMNYHDVPVPKLGRIVNTARKMSRSEVKDITMIDDSASEVGYRSLSKASITPENIMIDQGKSIPSFGDKELDVHTADFHVGPDIQKITSSNKCAGRENFDNVLSTNLFDKLDVIIWTALKQDNFTS